MHLKFRNVNDAFKGLVEGIHLGTIPTRRSPSRVGDVLMIEEPMTITYQKPLERVLFNQERDANPFFHLYESLWMLSGRNDVEPLKYYSSKIGDIASDDGKTFNGAYGYRWRTAWTHPTDIPEPIDQLKILIDHLKRVPNSRRAVLQMWNVEDDLLKLESTKDTCCNLSVLFSIDNFPCPKCNGTGNWYNAAQHASDEVQGHGGPNEEAYMEICPKCDGYKLEKSSQLNMTVTNRSNDMIWGMLGANVVHFSFLQEYMAACIGVEVGVYNQFTNNLHVYTENNGGFHPERWLSDKTDDLYIKENRKPFPLVRDPVMFDREVNEFVEEHSKNPQNIPIKEFCEPFLNNVARPMSMAYHSYKEKMFVAALGWCNEIAADDWRVACINWMLKRKTNYEKKLRDREAE